MMLVGIVSLAFGLVGILTESEASGNIAMLLGMFTGMGAVLFIFSVIRLLYLKFASAAKLKAEEILMKDERNVQVGRAAGAAANIAATLMFAVMAFAFVWMGYKIPAYIAVSAIWVQAAVLLIAQRVYEKRM
jgi:hypothetical protein